MIKSKVIRFALMGVMCLGSWPLSLAWAQEGEGGPVEVGDEVIEAGETLYMKWCINCHGEEGDGGGLAAEHLNPRPRNFRYGLYKIRSTFSGKIPTDQNLFDVISNGMPGSSMPAWRGRLKEGERWALVHFIKTFSRRFARAKEAPEEIQIGPRVASSAESIEEGRKLFQEIECFKCHGNAGRADGPSAPDLEDDLEFPIRPANLTKPWNFRGGHQPEDLYRRLQGGLAGSPMPSFSDTLDNEQTWHLINYLMSLWPDAEGNHPPLKVVLRAGLIEDAIPDDPNDAFWEERKRFYYPLVGQVIQDPRLFTPSVDGIQVQAVYNADELAFRLVWDDPTKSEADPDDEVYDDAVVVQLPIEIPTGAKRPYFLMGDEDLGVHMLRWSSSGVSELNGNGLTKVSAQSGASRQVTAVTEYDNGQYRVVFKRPLTTDDASKDTQLEAGRFIPIAFFVWDGSNGERGSQMAISHWYDLLMEPPVPKTVFVYPLVGLAMAAGAQWWIIRRLRRGKG